MPDFIPQGEAALAAWTRNFTQLIVQDPARFEISQAQATELQTRQDAFDLAFTAAAEPTTRTIVSVAMRDQCKLFLLDWARRLAWKARKTPGVTGGELLALGLRPLKEKISPVTAPDAAPRITANVIGSHAIRVQLRATAESRRAAKPAGVSGAAIFVALSDQAVTHASQWVYHSTQTRAAFDMTFRQTLPLGQVVYVCARWLNPRGNPGPTSSPYRTQLLGGVSMSMGQLAA